MVIEKKNMNEICHKLANVLIQKYKFKSVTGKKYDEVLIYENGIYSNRGRDVIKMDVERHLSVLCKNSHVNEITSKIIRKTIINRNTLDCNDKNLICINNGVLNIKIDNYYHIIQIIIL